MIDTTAPTIAGYDVFEWDCYKEAPVPEVFRQYYKVYDNVDGDITYKLTVANNALGMYTVGLTKDYEVVLKVVDSSGNETRKTILFRTKDINAPVLEVNDISINISSLGDSIFDNFYEQVITEIRDNSGKFSTIVKIEEVAGKMGFSGSYKVIVIVSDDVGNQTIQTAIINVIDDINPDFYLYTDLVNTTPEKVYSLDEIKECISCSLYNEGILYDSINLISCDYLKNEKTPGSYTVKYMYTYKGETNYMVGSIVVEDEKDSNSWLFILLLIPISIVLSKIIKKRKKLQ